MERPSEDLLAVATLLVDARTRIEVLEANLEELTAITQGFMESSATNRAEMQDRVRTNFVGRLEYETTRDAANADIGRLYKALGSVTGDCLTFGSVLCVAVVVALVLIWCRT